MNSKTTKKIIKKLSEEYGVSEKKINEIIRLYYLKVARSMEDGLKSEGKFNTIRVSGLGTFMVKKFVATKNSINIKTLRRMKENKPEYKIVVQSEPEKFVENNEAFHFLVKDNESPKLSIGDRIYIKYEKSEFDTDNKKNPLMVLDLEILDGKHPFYKAAIDLPEEQRYMFRRDGFTNILV